MEVFAGEGAALVKSPKSSVALFSLASKSFFRSLTPFLNDHSFALYILIRSSNSVISSRS
ncbi:hypothetical protein Sjap_000686 [Stephania japonica]|uniref:Uncharacterized protein n=1 Tax=Stephania japonica TaxID=461633 RepID=A0AAP0PUA7_9MAGN